MKNKIIKLFSAVLASFMLLICFSCNMFLIDEDESFSYVTINLDNNSRTVFPAVSESALTDVALFKNSVAEENLIQSWQNASQINGARIKLDTGNCKLILVAYQNNVPVSDEKDVEIVEGQNVVSFNLTLNNPALDYTTGTGSIDYKLIYPGTNSCNSPVFKLTNVNTSEIITKTESTTRQNSGKTEVSFKYSDIPAGVYHFIAQVRTNEKFAYYADYIYIANGYTSEGSGECELTDTGLIDKIKVKFYNDETLNKLLYEKECYPGEENFTSDWWNYIPDTLDDNHLLMMWKIAGTTQYSSSDYAPFHDASMIPCIAEKIKLSFNTNDANSDAIPDAYVANNWWLSLNYDSQTLNFSSGYNNSYSIPNPTKENKVFAGWYFNSELTEESAVSTWWSGYLTEDTTLYAKWIDAAPIKIMNGETEVKTIKVNPSYRYRFVLNQNTLRLREADDYTGNDIDSIDVPEVSGKVLSGCYYLSGENQRSAYNDFYVPETGLTVYLQWEDLCTITFNTNVNSVVETVNALKNERFIISKNNNNGNIYFNLYSSQSYTSLGSFSVPENEGKIFDGWYTDAECTIPLGNDTISLTSDVEYYAKWIDAYTIHFYTNVDSVVETVKVPKDRSFRIRKYTDSLEFYLWSNDLQKSIGEFTLQENEGYIFLNWYTDAECTVPVDNNSNITVTSDVNYYAKWVDSCVITLDAQGGIMNISSVTVQKDNPVYYYWFINGTANYGRTTSFVNDQHYYGAIPVPSKAGKEFAGWYTDTSYTTEVNMENPITVTGPVTLYAKWVDPCTINFVTNCDVTMASITVPSGMDYLVNIINNISHELKLNGNDCLYRIYSYDSSYPTKSGYTLTGWYTDSEFTTEVLSYTHKFTAPANGTVTLYAKWEAN